MIDFRPNIKFDKEALLVCLAEEKARASLLPRELNFLKSPLESAVSSKLFQGKSGQIFPLLLKNKLVLLTGLGKKSDLSLTRLRVLVKKSLECDYLKNKSMVELFLDVDPAGIVALIEGIVLGTYAWNKYRHKETEAGSVKHVKRARKQQKHYFVVAPKRDIYNVIITTCEGTNFARDLVNDNADVITSTYIETAIRRLIKGAKNVSIQVLNKRELKRQGLNLHLAVNQGSDKEPKLIIVRYAGGARDAGYTALVGKGMTFDTGGLNLKTSGNIESMRLDMSGAAAVVGTLKNIIKLKPSRNVIFTVSLAENVIDANAYKPGDVIEGYAKKTVEIANTDAEGRLILADAMAYLIKNYKVRELVDIATLTGACITALGYDYTGIMATDERLYEKLVRAAHATDDRVWRLPLYPELKESVKSKIADIRNLGFPKGAAGAMTAAEFLRQFTDNKPWAHLDIAGPSFVENNNRLYFGHGATGAGVRLLTYFLTH